MMQSGSSGNDRCHLKGDELVISEANLFVDSRRAARKPLDGATDASTKSPAVASTPETRKSPELPPAFPNTDTSPTPGKMEVVVKLNQFPDDVRTVDKGWKEFYVDTGDLMVTVTVKPKAFAALEQAQQTYPLWIAAISGQMGAQTATGFLLESPAIKVFERQRKDSAATEQTARKDNSFASKATEPQPEPPKTTKETTPTQ